MMNENDCILSVRGLDIRFNLRGRVLHAIRGIDLDLYRGEVLAVVGESGSGKSVFTKSFMGLLDTNGSITGGTIDYCPTPGAEPVRLSGLKTGKDWLRIRGREIAMIMQDPMTSLNPLKTIGDQILEAVTLHQGLKGTEARARTLEYLRDVGISDPEVRFKQYPHEFSGGMRQRVVIAIAVACSPKILICDEPTTALDVTIQAQILQLLKELRAKYHLTIVMITHDLGVVANIADRVAVMYAGDIVEIGTADEIYYDPRHPYTWALLSSMPQMGIKGEDLFNIVGTPPNLFAEIRGDAFAPRNPQALKIDYVKRPPYFEVSPTHKAKTWLLDPRAPHIEPPAAVKNCKRRACKMAEEKEVLLEVKDLNVTYGSGRKAFAAVQNANFQIYKGETFGLVGESGSGKTTIGRAILRILPTSGGEILYKGQKINGKIPRALDKQITREIQMIFQDPQSSLNERAKVSYIVGEGLQNVRPDLSAAQREEKVRQALLDVGLLPEFASRFPHEFSGGQRQRIGIARALIVEPEFIVADEPISALDMSIRAQVLNLLRRLQKERGITYLFIAHDLSVMRYISDRIAVIHKGSIVELADAEELVAHAIHPYTRSLLSAIPMPDPRRERNKKLLVYDPAMHDYSTEAPQWRELRPRHWVLCSAAEAAQWLPQA